MSVYQPRRTITPAVWAAFAASLAVHGLAIFGLPPFGSPPEIPPQAPLEVRIGALEQPPAPPPAASRRPRRTSVTARRAEPARRPPVPAEAASPPPARADAVPAEPVGALISPDGPALPAELQAALSAISPGGDGAAPSAPPPDARPGPPPAGAQPEGEPAHYPFKRVELKFDLLYGANPMRLGTVTHRLIIEGDHYAIEQVGEGSGLIGALYERVIGGRLIQRSAGTIGPAGFVPDEFFAQRGRVERRERAAFNWTEGWVELSSRGNDRKLALAPGTQDVVSMLHQLFFLQPLPRMGRLTVATGRKLSNYAFEVIGEERVATASGPRDALHVRRLDPDGDRVDLWLDEARDMLPVRIYSAYRDGLVLDFVLRSSSVVAAN